MSATSFIKKAALWLVAAFAIYTVIATPDVAAQFIRSVSDAVQYVWDGMLTFFRAVSPS